MKLNKIITRFQIILIIFNRIIFYSFLFLFFDFKNIINATFSSRKIELKNIKIDRLINFINKLFRYLWIKSCFKKTLIIKDVLKKLGWSSKIVIGVSLNDKFSSHCWLNIPFYNAYTETKEIRDTYKIIEVIDYE